MKFKKARQLKEIYNNARLKSLNKDLEIIINKLEANAIEGNNRVVQNIIWNKDELEWLITKLKKLGYEVININNQKLVIKF